MTPKRTPKKKSVTRRVASLSVRPSPAVLAEVRELISAALQQVAQVVNAGLAMLYWQIGARIRKDVLKEKRVEYGDEILPTLSAKLVPEFGRRFGVRNLARMTTFAEAYPDQNVVMSLMTQLGWSHFVELLSFKDDLKRDFYAELFRDRGWGQLFGVRRLVAALSFSSRLHSVSAI